MFSWHCRDLLCWLLFPAQGFLFSEARELVGVEINDYFCDLTRRMLDRHGMASRCQVRTLNCRSVGAGGGGGQGGLHVKTTCMGDKMWGTAAAEEIGKKLFGSHLRLFDVM